MNKFNKGVTLVSLTIYIILCLLAIGMLSTITTYFMKNLDDITISQKSDDLFNSALAYINNDLNNKELIYIKTGKDGADREYLVFKFNNDSEHIYNVEEGSLYFLTKEKSNSSEFDKNIVLGQAVSAVGNNEIFKFEDQKLNIKINILGKNFAAILSTNLSN